MNKSDSAALVLAIVSLIAAVVALAGRRLYVALGAIAAGGGAAVWVLVAQPVTAAVWAVAVALAWSLAPVLCVRADPLSSGAKGIGLVGIWPANAGGQAVAQVQARLGKSRRIDILCVDALVFLRLAQGDLIEALKRPGFEMNVVIAAPGTDLLTDEAAMRTSGDDPGTYPHRVAERLRHLEGDNDAATSLIRDIAREARAQLPPAKQGHSRVRLRRFRTEIRQSFMVLDGTWGWVSPNAPPRLTLDLPGFELTNGSGSLLASLLEHFDRLCQTHAAEWEEVV